MVLLAKRQHFRESHRDFYEALGVSTSLPDELGLRKMPHWRMLHKFSKLASTRRLECLLLTFLEEAGLRVLHLAVDSTGFSPTSASAYYVRTLERKTGKSRRPRHGRLVRRYLRQTMVVETKSSS
jgi:hypothetical protein